MRFRKRTLVSEPTFHENPYDPYYPRKFLLRERRTGVVGNEV
ncbi:hypothetical protein LEP1GSC133_1993 [Leptospira borgpetersenii serovar Pomona str. 200901868]|uniref:Uncharacterized protein n=1 Tax=Leptospira borgpetersenii serovar Pomona str. 200901868 TaxID=1192866 RepID=M6WF40_LEPBO|nr:hypothetical protein LEP1GSC133_1993 [Leptospira borgpetersenii serovar Pomona str. 200901868]